MAKKKTKKKTKTREENREEGSAKDIARTEELMRRAQEAGKRYTEEYLPGGTFAPITTGITPEIRERLDRLRELERIAGEYTGLEEESLGGLRAGLGGYLAPELQAQREMALQGVNQDLATQLRLQELAGARNRVRGAAGFAQQQGLQNQALQARGNIERDLFARNADEIQRRRQAFADIVNSTEAARFGRQQGASALYGTELAGEEATQRSMEQFNIAQRQNEALARAGLGQIGAGIYTGILGGERGVNAAEEQNRFIQNYLQQQNEFFKNQLAALRRSGGSSAQGGSTNTGSSATG